MKITDVRVIVTCPGRNFVLLKIETNEGICGVGDAALNGMELSVASLLENHLAAHFPRHLLARWTCYTDSSGRDRHGPLRY